jgi:hypothetical protein
VLLFYDKVEMRPKRKQFGVGFDSEYASFDTPFSKACCRFKCVFFSYLFRNDISNMHLLLAIKLSRSLKINASMINSRANILQKNYIIIVNIFHEFNLMSKRVTSKILYNKNIKKGHDHLIYSEFLLGTKADSH